MREKYRIGMIGHGYIGRSLYQSFAGSEVQIASVYDHRTANIADLPQSIATADADAFIDTLAGLDLVVEVAHPDVTAKIGARVLGKTNYMPCSVVALADEELRQQLLAVARQADTRLYIPHGAVVGMDELIEARSGWKSATITFRKPPALLDAAGHPQADGAVLFEGSAREIAKRFPRSVNAMVACALATVGLDVTTTRMVADSRFGNVLRGEFEFVAENGARLTIIKEEPGVGVSGVGMMHSIKGSVMRVLRVKVDNPIFV